MSGQLWFAMGAVVFSSACGAAVDLHHYGMAAFCGLQCCGWFMQAAAFRIREAIYLAAPKSSNVKPNEAPAPAGGNG